MPYERAKPSKEGLYAAYVADVDLNRYVQLKKKYKSHDAAMAIVSGDEISEFQIDRAIDLGVTITEIGQTYSQHVNLRRYISARHAAGSGINVSHAQAVEIANLGIESYSIIVYSGEITHEQVLAFHEEFGGDGTEFGRYCDARARGISIEASSAFSAEHRLSGYGLQKALKAKISVEELLDALQHQDYDDENIIEKTYGYIDLREAAHNEGFIISHKEAIEAAKMEWPVKYIEARREGKDHEQATNRVINYFLDLRFGRT